MNHCILSIKTPAQTMLLAALLGLAACQQQPTVVTETASVAAESTVQHSAPVEACECPHTKEESCPQLVAAVVVEPEQEKNRTVNDKLLVGRVEYVTLQADQLTLKAKIDTGAKTSSLHALDLTAFERDGEKWVRFAMLDPKTDKKISFESRVVKETKVKQQDAQTQLRPTVSMSITFGTVEEQINFTLTDRSGYLYQVLIGRNFLRDRAIVDVSHTFITRSME